MKHPLKLSCCILFAAVLFGCASPYKPVTDPSQPFHSALYSVLPPGGQGWIYVSGSTTGKNEIAFTKKESSVLHTYAASVTEVHHAAKFGNKEQFMDFWKKLMSLGTDPRRFETVNETSDFVDRFGEYCVLHSSDVKDRFLVGQGGPLLHLRTKSYSFVHPGKDDTIISVSYSERATEDKRSANFDAMAEGFFSGFKLKTP